MRLIDVDKALEIVRDQGKEHPNAYHLTNYATLILQEAPTVNPEDLRPKGKWDQGVCTNCGFDIGCLTDGENDLEQWVWDEGFDYCPNCGAKLEG